MLETSILTPKKLFQREIRYTVPAFQRRYVWTQDEQWEPLWDDVRNTADDYLEQLQHADGVSVEAERRTTRHFLGAVVVQQVSTAVKDLERREVIDGQQRITTLQLLLDAVQHVCEERGLTDVAKRLAKLVTNDADNEDDIFKVWPTRSDQEAFRHAMHNGLATEGYEDSLVVQAHEHFRLRTEEWLDSNDRATQARAEALETALTGMLQMVVIDLGALDDPHVIFETLNARGTPLLESDLIKNFVISKAASTDQANIWRDLDQDWWREDFRQGRLLRPRIDALLDYWLEMRTSEDVAVGRVFDTFRDIAEGRPIEDVVSEVRHDLSNYRIFEQGPRVAIEDTFYYRTNVMQMGAFTPLILCLLSKPDAARAGAFRALESFLVRRMVCRYTTKDYNRLTLDLVRELRKFEPETVGKAVAGFLRSQKADSRRWPTDEDVEVALGGLPLYRLLTRDRLRLILEAVEERCRTTSLAEETNVKKNLTVEHILPQSWETHWPLPSDIDEHAARQNRNRLVHTVGNLTLIDGRLNSESSNAPWEDKREKLKEHSVLHLNKRLLDDYGNLTWNEQRIQARSQQMAALIVDVWPGPDSSVWETDA